jgi:hypothetical protein
MTLAAKDLLKKSAQLGGILIPSVLLRCLGGGFSDLLTQSFVAAQEINEFS